jgi:RNA polymerase sigma factor (TIGR02999 family)
LRLEVGWDEIRAGFPLSERTGPVTDLLQAWSRGDAQAGSALFTLVYRDLRRRAGAYLRHERIGHTLDAAALVHEAYLKLVAQDRVAWQGRSQFLGVAAQAMRRILVDHARRRHARKREAPEASAPSAAARPFEAFDLEVLDRALHDLAALDPLQGRIVELRFFGGLSVEETAEVLGVSASTVKREWRMARAWLYTRLRDARLPS